MELTEEEIQKGIEIAKNARQNAFAYWSGHKIGACIITTDGEFFGGCNTENDISGFGVCAERSAVDHAVVNGKYEYKGLVVYDDEYIFPCGACLQYLEIFSQIDDTNIPIILAQADGAYTKHYLKELLPEGYRTKKNIDVIKGYKNKEDTFVTDM